MPNSVIEKSLILFFRLTMAWTFLYAASHQVFVPTSPSSAFSRHTKTFHNLFAMFTTPTMAPITTFLVEYGHLLIGLSLLFGLMVRVSAAFGVLLMGIYWMAHMDWPFVENTTNFDLRLSPGLCRRAGLPDRQARGPCLGPRRLGRKSRFLQAASGLKPLVA